MEEAGVQRMDFYYVPVEGMTPIGFITVRYPVMAMARPLNPTAASEIVDSLKDRLTQQKRAYPGGPFPGLEMSIVNGKEMLYVTDVGQIVAEEWI